MGYGSDDYNAGYNNASTVSHRNSLMDKLNRAREDRETDARLDDVKAQLQDKQVDVESMANAAANRFRKAKAWDNIVWEIVKRIKDFDPDTRYRILGVCKGQDATPEDTLRALREVQEAWYQKIKAAAPKDNSDTDIPEFRYKYDI